MSGFCFSFSFSLSFNLVNNDHSCRERLWFDSVTRNFRIGVTTVDIVRFKLRSRVGGRITIMRNGESSGSMSSKSEPRRRLNGGNLNGFAIAFGGRGRENLGKTGAIRVSSVIFPRHTYRNIKLAITVRINTFNRYVGETEEISQTTRDITTLIVV